MKDRKKMTPTEFFGTNDLVLQLEAIAQSAYRVPTNVIESTCRETAHYIEGLRR